MKDEKVTQGNYNPERNVCHVSLRLVSPLGKPKKLNFQLSLILFDNIIRFIVI